MNNKYALKVSITTVIGNFFLSIIKFLAGIFANSNAMISDAVHTLSDVFTTIIAMVGVTIGNSKEDENHQYGHERLECIASLLLAFILFITGFEIGFEALKVIIKNDYNNIAIPGIFAIVAAIISIVFKELMYQYTIKVAKKIQSDALKADAWHHRSDALSSIGALIGITLARFGYTIFEPIVSVIIAILICKVAIDIFLEATNKLVDKSCDVEKINMIKSVVLKEKGVIAIDDIKTRIFGNKIYVDIEIALDGKKSLNETHRIAEKVHDRVENEFADIKHIMVHVNPYRKRKKYEK